jgi:hypothetical protein
MSAVSNWPAAVLASAFGTHYDSQKLTMAICVAYLEASRQDATLTVAGLVSPKARWQSFEERWPRALRAEGLTSFNGHAFVQGTGEFSNGWDLDAGRRRRLIAALSAVAGDSAILGVSCSVRLADYKIVTRGLPHMETAPTPYAVCAGVAMARILEWMRTAHSTDVTLFVFEDGGIDHQQVRQVAAAKGIEHGEPVQIWPREWLDEHGRRRLLRPIEACDLLMPDCGSDLADRLIRRSSWDQETLDRNGLSGIFESLRADQSSVHEATASRSSREMS